MRQMCAMSSDQLSSTSLERRLKTFLEVLMTKPISDKQLQRLARLVGPAAAKQWSKVLTRARCNTHHGHAARARSGKKGRHCKV